MKSVCFTGHRKITVTESLKARLISRILLLVNDGFYDFYAGGALGWDMLCEKAVTEVRESRPEVRLHLVLPCPADEQTAKWNKSQKEDYQKILEAADDVQIISEHYTESCMKKRNARLIDLADCCVCYCKVSRSGTGQTVRMAEKKGIIIFNLAE